MCGGKIWNEWKWISHLKTKAFWYVWNWSALSVSVIWRGSDKHTAIRKLSEKDFFLCKCISTCDELFNWFHCHFIYHLWKKMKNVFSSCQPAVWSRGSESRWFHWGKCSNKVQYSLVRSGLRYRYVVAAATII